MKQLRKGLASLLALTMALSAFCVSASAKTMPSGQTVDTVLFYVRNSAGENVLVSHVTVEEMEADMASGAIDSTNHNYSLLDRYVTTVHQETQGFTVSEFVDYAKSKSDVEALRTFPFTYTGNDTVGFWEIDQSGFDDADTYTYGELYGQPRYNFPLLYEYWDYRTQDYYDPAGVMTRDEVIDYIFEDGEQESVQLSVRAFSQRYMVTDEKYDSGDYNMENAWLNSGLLDNQRTIRLMKPMTEAELRGKTSTVADTRYWIANILLDMEKDPDVASLGRVAVPAAVMTEDDEYYYIAFRCATEGAVILFNHNYGSPSYTPTCEYTGGAVAVPKSSFPNGTVTMTCRAVKDGYTDAGVQTLTLTSSGRYEKEQWENSFTDVAPGAWYYDNVAYVMENGLFDAVSPGKFGPEEPMTRAMLAAALYRMADSPKSGGVSAAPFTDVAVSASYADAVAWAYATGVVNGTSDTTFSPNDTITREQIVTMFYRYAQNVANADMTPLDSLAAFTDAGGVADWALEQMRWAVAAGLINGTTDTTLTPQKTATRSETAALVQRLAGYV